MTEPNASKPSPSSFSISEKDLGCLEELSRAIGFPEAIYRQFSLPRLPDSVESDLKDTARYNFIHMATSRFNGQLLTRAWLVAYEIHASRSGLQEIHFVFPHIDNFIIERSSISQSNEKPA